MATTTQHQAISDIFLEHAAHELEKGVLLQASEKAWGAVAHYVKSIARERGWPNRSHADANMNARRLIAETDDPKANETKLRAVNALHHNFYEAYFDKGAVKGGIVDAQELIDAMKIAASLPPRREGLRR